MPRPLSLTEISTASDTVRVAMRIRAPAGLRDVIHGIRGVDEQVHQDLGDVVGDGGDRGNVVAEVEFEFDAAEPVVVADEAAGRLDQRIEVEQLCLRRVRRGERRHLAHDPRDPLRLAEYLGRELVHRLARDIDRRGLVSSTMNCATPAIAAIGLLTSCPIAAASDPDGSHLLVVGALLPFDLQLLLPAAQVALHAVHRLDEAADLVAPGIPQGLPGVASPRSPPRVPAAA